MASEPLSAASDRDIHDAHIYDRLVEDEQDVEGLLAYALYKKVSGLGCAISDSAMAGRPSIQNWTSLYIPMTQMT